MRVAWVVLILAAMPLHAIRLQAAIVRSVLDEVERLPRGEYSRDLAIELADELDRLASRVRDGAARVRATIPPPRESGVVTDDEPTHVKSA